VRAGFECVADQHGRDGEEPEDRERVHEFDDKEAPPRCRICSAGEATGPQPRISPSGSRGPQNSPLRFKQTPFAAIPLALRSHLWYKQIIQVCPLPGRPEFHAEWLRDGPCDATTTCLGKPGVWCQLSLAIRGGEHEIRQSLQRSFLKAACKLHESYQVRSSLSRSRARVSAVARIDARDL
jgi:hypothetical protein